MRLPDKAERSIVIVTVVNSVCVCDKIMSTIDGKLNSVALAKTM